MSEGDRIARLEERVGRLEEALSRAAGQRGSRAAGQRDSNDGSPSVLLFLLHRHRLLLDYRRLPRRPAAPQPC